MRRWLAGLLVVAVAGVAVAAMPRNPTTKLKRGPNLVKNGNFDDATDPLNHWIISFDDNSNYINNYKLVSVVDDPDKQRGKVARLDGRDPVALDNQGIRLFSEPIPYDPTKAYKLSMYVKTQNTKYKTENPCCRIYVAAYGWHPKGEKSDHPRLQDIRQLDRFKIIYFNGEKTGPLSRPGKNWTYGETTFPAEKRSKMEQHHLENCMWMVIHINFLDATMSENAAKNNDWCHPGFMYVSDVRLEEIGEASKVDLEAGGQTKGFSHGQKMKDSPKSKLTPIGPRPASSKKKKSSQK